MASEAGNAASGASIASPVLCHSLQRLLLPSRPHQRSPTKPNSWSTPSKSPSNQNQSPLFLNLTTLYLKWNPFQARGGTRRLRLGWMARPERELLFSLKFLQRNTSLELMMVREQLLRLQIWKLSLTLRIENQVKHRIKQKVQEDFDSSLQAFQRDMPTWQHLLLPRRKRHIMRRSSFSSLSWINIAG